MTRHAVLAYPISHASPEKDADLPRVSNTLERARVVALTLGAMGETGSAEVIEEACELLSILSSEGGMPSPIEIWTKVDPEGVRRIRFERQEGGELVWLGAVGEADDHRRLAYPESQLRFHNWNPEQDVDRDEL